MDEEGLRFEPLHLEQFPSGHCAELQAIGPRPTESAEVGADYRLSLLTRQTFIGKNAFEFWPRCLSFAIPGTVIGVSYISGLYVPALARRSIDRNKVWILIVQLYFPQLPVGVRAALAVYEPVGQKP